MAHTNFETPVSAPALYGTLDAAIHEHGGVQPTRIIQTDTPWSVHINWSLKGDMAPMICGKWHVHVRLESMGPGGETSLFDPDCQLDLNPGGNGDYSCHFDVPANRVKAAHDGTPYRVLVTLTYRNAVGKPGPMAAYYDAGIVQFYNA